MESNADDYFEAFQLACESRHPRLMDVSLDAIHYLMGTLYATDICFSAT
jgi:hypothetical protein